jgi:hypothetical protein
MGVAPSNVSCGGPGSYDRRPYHRPMAGGSRRDGDVIWRENTCQYAVFAHIGYLLRTMTLNCAECRSRQKHHERRVAPTPVGWLKALRPNFLSAPACYLLLSTRVGWRFKKDRSVGPRVDGASQGRPKPGLSFRQAQTATEEAPARDCRPCFAIYRCRPKDWWESGRVVVWSHACH